MIAWIWWVLLSGLMVDCVLGDGLEFDLLWPVELGCIQVWMKNGLVTLFIAQRDELCVILIYHAFCQIPINAYLHLLFLFFHFQFDFGLSWLHALAYTRGKELGRRTWTWVSILKPILISHSYWFIYLIESQSWNQTKLCFLYDVWMWVQVEPELMRNSITEFEDKVVHDSEDEEVNASRVVTHKWYVSGPKMHYRFVYISAIFFLMLNLSMISSY